MKRLLLMAVLMATAAGCMSIESRVDRKRFGANPYLEPPFYARYLDSRNRLDQQIQQHLQALATDPGNPVLHNELGSLLVQKGFPKDADREFSRALHIDDRFYPAWYNLALLRDAQGNSTGALRALRETVDLKPGHAAAHFQIGLIEESRGHSQAAIDAYAKAFAINPNLLEVSVNPRILDSKLVTLALLRNYDPRHETKSLQFQGAPKGYVPPAREEAASPQELPQDIVTPAPPATEQGVQPAIPVPAPTPQRQ